ncbi:MAG: M20/M25/M40 family metallo-hydrolase [Pyrinomonadaceae bacterium]
MKKQLFILLFLLIFGLTASAQVPEQSETEKQLRAHVSYLASDDLEGRRTGEKGATFAAGYIANMFASYKLKTGVISGGSGKEKDSFLQSFPYVSGVEAGESSLLQFSDTREITDISLGRDWAPLGFSPNEEIPFAPVVFAGFGISSEKLKYDDFEGLDVKDKIVLAFDGTPDHDNPHNQFFLFNAHAKANVAKEKGAKALILISRSEKFADDKLALSFDQTLGETAIPTIVISRQTAARFLKLKEADLINEENTLNSIAKGEAKRVSLKIRSEEPLLANINVDVKKTATDAYNVVGVLEGTDPRFKDQVIVIGAHYDHLGHGGSGSLDVNSKEIHHGADDNASGTSALLELARQFSEKRGNKRTIMFIAFGGEEEGLLGSKYFVNNPTVPLERIVAMINMDMVGRLKDKKLTVGGIGTAAELRDLVTKKNEVILPVYVPQTNGSASFAPKTESVYRFDLQLNEDGFGPSDHSSFYGKKIPVLFFFTGTHSDYHKPSDTAEKINYQGLEKIVNYVSDIANYLDQHTAKLTYSVAKSSGMSGGRRGFNVSLGTVPSYADGDNTGLVLDGVRDKSAAAKAGVKAGDKIIKLGDKDIRNISDYVFVLGEMKAGEEYEIVVMRGKEKVKLKIIPDER